MTPSQAETGARALADGMRRAFMIVGGAYLFVAPVASTAGIRGALLVAGVALLVAKWRETITVLRAGFPRDVAVAGVLWVLLGAASLAWSVAPRYSAGELKTELLYPVGVFVVYFVAAARFPATWNAWSAAAMSGGLLVFAAQVVQDLTHFTFGREGAFGGPGPFATELVLLFPLVLSLRSARPWGRAWPARGLAVGVLVLFAAAAYSQNRIVWLALAVQLVIFVAASGGVGALRTKGTWRYLVPSSLIAMAGGFALSMIHRDELYPQFAGLQDLRLTLWRTAWHHFLEAPWLGHGFGREILASSFAAVGPPPEVLYLPHAHNTLINIALELGLAGLAVFLALVLALARHFRAMSRDAQWGPLGATGLALLAGFVVKNLTDDFLHRQNALVFWALNGALLGIVASARLPPRAAEAPTTR